MILILMITIFLTELDLKENKVKSAISAYFFVKPPEKTNNKKVKNYTKIEQYIEYLYFHYQQF